MLRPLSLFCSVYITPDCSWEVCYLDLIFLSWRFWFHANVLALVNCAALRTGVHEWFQIHIFSGSKPRSERVGFANHMVPLRLVFVLFFFFFLRKLMPLPILPILIYIPTRRKGGFRFPKPSAGLTFNRPFWCRSFWAMWGDSSWWFWLALF